MKRLTTYVAVAVAVTVASACDPVPGPTDLQFEAAEARRPKPPPAPDVEEFDLWDPAVWVPGDHPLGKGYLDPSNVSLGSGELLLTLPGSGFDGAELRSAERHSLGSYEARVKTPIAPGSISAFFLYELSQRSNDEIDIEIFNDGTRRIWFTTWVGGVETNHAEAVLPFDPAAAYHDYRIEWSRKKVDFFVDGVLARSFVAGIPRARMHVFANTWWPTWLSGTPPSSPRSMRIDRIQY